MVIMRCRGCAAALPHARLWGPLHRPGRAVLPVCGGIAAGAGHRAAVRSTRAAVMFVNSIMASVPGHPFWKAIITEMLEVPSHYQPPLDASCICGLHADYTAV